MSNLDWFRLWTIEHEKGHSAGPQGPGGFGEEHGFSGRGDGFDGGSHGFGAPHSGYSPWGSEAGWRPHLLSETSQSECPSAGSGRAYGREYHDDAPSGHSSFFGDNAQHHDDGRDGLMPGAHGGGMAGLGGGDSFDAILFGHLDAGGLHAGFGPGALVVIPIEHLEINQNTLIQNTNILFDAHDGGSVAVGGNVTALSSQTGLIDHVPDTHAVAA